MTFEQNLVYFDDYLDFDEGVKVRAWFRGSDDSLKCKFIDWDRRLFPESVPISWDWYFFNNLNVNNDKVRMVFFDLECDDSDPALDLSSKKILSCVFIDEVGKTLEFCEDDELKLLLKIYDVFKSYDLIIGFYSAKFDFPLLVARGERHGINFSRFSWKFADLYQIFKKFNNINIILSTAKLKSWSLNSLGEHFLSMGKEEIPRGGAGSIKKLFDNNRKLLMKYNKRDVEILKGLCDKFDVKGTLSVMSELTKVPISSICRSVGICVEFMVLQEILNKPKEKRQFLLAKLVGRSLDLQDSYKGAIVFIREEDGGFYKNVGVFDFKSLYPNIMRTFNISFETLSELSDEEYKALHDSFSKDVLLKLTKMNRGLLAEISDDLQKRRLIYKKSGEKTKEVSVKLLNNSLYGYFGGRYSRFRNIKVAETITLCSRELISLVYNEFHGITGDTDSCFIEMKSPDESDLLEKKINDFLKSKLSFLPSYHLKMDFKFFFESLILLKKKRYVGFVSKGENSGQVWGKGIELVRSDFTVYGKNLLNELLKMILVDKCDFTEISSFLMDKKRSFLKGEVSSEELVLIHSLSKLPREYKGNLPHIRIAREKEKQGVPFYVGQKINYLISGRDSKGNLVGGLPEDCEPDYYLYWTRKILPTMSRILFVSFKSRDRELKNLFTNLNIKEDVVQTSILNWS